MHEGVINYYYHPVITIIINFYESSFNFHFIHYLTY